MPRYEGLTPDEAAEYESLMVPAVGEKLSDQGRLDRISRISELDKKIIRTPHINSIDDIREAAQKLSDDEFYGNGVRVPSAQIAEMELQSMMKDAGIRVTDADYRKYKKMMPSEQDTEIYSIDKLKEIYQQMFQPYGED